MIKLQSESDPEYLANAADDLFLKEDQDSERMRLFQR